MIRRPDPSLLDLYDALLFDLDGTLMHGARPIPHAAESVETARAAGRTVVFATNNASRTPQQAAEHLGHVGIPARPEEFVTSPQVASRLLADRLAPGEKVLVVGGESLAAQIREAGLTPVGTDAEDVAAVVQGWSPDLDWGRLAEGAYAIRRGALWMATNVDATLPTERGLAPGNGSMVAALRHATGAVPDVAGKPEPGMFQIAAREHGARRPLIIGDRLDTDIEGAVRAGMDSLLVLTGVDGVEAALRAEPVRRPTFVLPDLSSLAAPFPLPVVSQDGSRCGAVSAAWDDGDIVLHGAAEDPRVLRAVLALLRTHSAEKPWTGRLRDRDRAELQLAGR
ncbi:HAD-IIA family hydrolase [Brachybacterium saurashtrense]|uniref:HAD-IIA family hydrolase n=1 Tax=Brachybacterium saurashtrense TaxID=556288 RepID=A0A345YLU0_9MICO|nr:HAD-IIA family hydrolase [Brachybacterium saurashtrense]AXK44892.1 HAD-IIA family hydrolase [Brachybacterium saurashtrense]RRR21576.1 HAD-IIA family hydrolase [Brachybacterium saurashtrense]